MASAKAKAYLAAIGMPVLSRVHTKVELGNFRAGRGTGRYILPYHTVRMNRESGDSKRTIGCHATLTQARRETVRLRQAHKIDNESTRYGYYIRNILNGNIYRG